MSSQEGRESFDSEASHFHWNTFLCEGQGDKKPEDLRFKELETTKTKACVQRAGGRMSEAGKQFVKKKMTHTALEVKSSS